MDHMLGHGHARTLLICYYPQEVHCHISFFPFIFSSIWNGNKGVVGKQISPLLAFKSCIKFLSPLLITASNRPSCLATCSFSLLSVSVSSFHSTEQTGKYAAVGEHLYHRCLLVLQVRLQILRAAGVILPFPVLGNPICSCLCSLDRTLPQTAKIPYKTNTFYSSKRTQATPRHKNVHVSSRGLLLYQSPSSPKAFTFGLNTRTEANG